MLNPRRDATMEFIADQINAGRMPVETVCSKLIPASGEIKKEISRRDVDNARFFLTFCQTPGMLKLVAQFLGKDPDIDPTAIVQALDTVIAHRDYKRRVKALKKARKSFWLD